MEWARWHFAKTKFDCELCRLARKDRGELDCEGIDRLGECPENLIPSLSPGNRQFWGVFSRIMPGLIRGEGQFDYAAIEFIFNLFVPKPQRAFYMDKAIAVMMVIREQWQKN